MADEQDDPPRVQLPPHGDQDAIDQGRLQLLTDALALALDKRVRFLMGDGQSRLDACKEAEDANAYYADRAKTAPLDDVEWGDIYALEQVEGASAAVAKWHEIRVAACTTFRGGGIAAQAVECSWTRTPWERAIFFALREDLAGAYLPANAAEQVLIDCMAQALTLQNRWMQILCDRMHRDREEARNPTGSFRKIKYVNQAQDIAEAEGMIDRWNRMLLRNMRALQTMRRFTPVIVNNGGQVNVGQQQVNVTGNVEARSDAG